MLVRIESPLHFPCLTARKRQNKMENRVCGKYRTELCFLEFCAILYHEAVGEELDAAVAKGGGCELEVT